MQVLFLVFLIPLISLTVYCTGLGLLGLVRPDWSYRLGMRYLSGFTFGAAACLGLFLFFPPVLILSHYMDPIWMQIGIGLGGMLALFFVALGTLLKRNFGMPLQLLFMSLHLIDNAISHLGKRKHGIDRMMQRGALEASLLDPTLAAAVNAIGLAALNVGLTCWAIDLLGLVQNWDSLAIGISLVGLIGIAIVYAGAAITEQDAHRLDEITELGSLD